MRSLWIVLAFESREHDESEAKHIVRYVPVAVQEVDLRGNNLKDNGAMVIGRALRQMQNSCIKKIDLGYNEIQEDGAFTIANVSPLTSSLRFVICDLCSTSQLVFRYQKPLKTTTLTMWALVVRGQGHGHSPPPPQLRLTFKCMCVAGAQEQPGEHAKCALLAAELHQWRWQDGAEGGAGGHL
jgi:hypothetical protein